MDKITLKKRVPIELVDYKLIKNLIDEQDLKYYKCSIAIDINYKSFLQRLSGNTRFTLRELIELADVLNVKPGEFIKSGATWEEAIDKAE